MIRIFNEGSGTSIQCDRCGSAHMRFHPPSKQSEVQSQLVKVYRDTGWLIQSERDADNPDLCNECYAELKDGIVELTYRLD